MTNAPGPARRPTEKWYSLVDACHRETFQVILESSEFLACSTFRDQILWIFTCFPFLPQHQVALFFGVKTGSVQNQKRYADYQPKAVGRPPCLSSEMTAAVLTFIRDRNAKNDPPTVNDALNMLWETFLVDVIPDTFRKWLNEKTVYKTLVAAPMEEDRMAVSQESISQYFETLEREVNGMPAALVLNLDESGFQRYADARHNAVIVPASYTKAFYPVPRNETRKTFLAAVAAAGLRLKPLVIAQRKTVEGELLMAGYTSDHAVIVHSETGYISSELFLEYIRRILIPYVNMKRAELSYQGPAVLIMDGCSCHTSAQALDLLRRANVKAILLPAHSSDQTQVCDLGLFGNMKSAQSRIHPPPTASVQSQQMMKMISAYHGACHPGAITSAFQRAGISNVIHEGCTYLQCEVTRYTATAIRHPPEGWTEAPDAHIADMRKKRIPIGNGLWGDNIPPLPEGPQVTTPRVRQYRAPNNQQTQTTSVNTPIFMHGPLWPYPNPYMQQPFFPRRQP